MANRHLSRSVVLQTLFEWDFNHKNLPSITSTLNNNAEEFADGSGDREYMDVLLAGVLQNVEALDKVIEKAAPDWPLEKIAIVDRNILRIGLYELLFGDHDEAPPKVAINEAIEKLNNIKPSTMSHLSRISGIKPSDISAILVALGR